MQRHVLWPALAAAAITVTAGSAQEIRAPGGRDSVQLVPGPHYRAGWFHRWLLGDHYRDLWTGPIKVAVLDLNGTAGGLTPECRGGGLQTASLRLRGADGRDYVFRSADKDPAPALLPGPLRRTPAADLLRDQISSHHPAGALVVAPLLDAVGVLHVEPQLRVMPDHPAVAGFRQPFAGMLGTIEERPRDGFNGAGRVENTEDVWRRIEASSADQVDARAYLVARLIDILVGDWDRHFDQWAWAEYPQEGGRVWRPVPRDRDQAFAKLDGLVPSVARRYLPQLVSFEASYPSIYGLTWSARALDRRLLVALEKPVWDSVVRMVQSRLSDAVLGTAVERLPPEMGRHRTDLLDALRARRDSLPHAAEQFYPLVAEYADVRATDENDVAEIDRFEDGRVRVRLAPARAVGTPYFVRTFRLSDTKEIRLYLAGGDDHAVVRGTVARSLAVRIVGGNGDDVLIDSSLVGLPIVRSILTSTFFYDSDGENHFGIGPGTELDERRFRPPPRTDVYPGRPPDSCGGARFDPPARDLGDPFRDWGSRWLPAPFLSFQPNLGLIIGAGTERVGYAFRKTPYGSRVGLRAAFATGPRRWRVSYEGDFRNLPRRAWASFAVRYSGIEGVRFHGFGNETVLAAPARYYAVTQRQVSANTALTLFPPRSRVSFGPFFEFAETELGQGGLIDSLRPYGSEGFAQFGAQGRLELDTRDRTWAPRRGLHFIAGVRVVPAVFDATSSYGFAYGEAATYASVGEPARVTLAVRVGGKNVWGRAPFHAAASSGGATTVRAYNERRFAGDAAVYGNAELRLLVTKFSLFLPGELGVLALGDMGRVYLRGERSERWHRAAGGGLWIAFVERGSTVTLTVARSPERWAYYGGLGFMF